MSNTRLKHKIVFEKEMLFFDYSVVFFVFFTCSSVYLNVSSRGKNTFDFVGDCKLKTRSAGNVAPVCFACYVNCLL